jgi:uncharacterized protein
MKIGVVSDTHRNADFLHTAIEWMTQRQKISSLYHLGDDYEDVADLSDTYMDIVQVPGIYDKRYLDGSLPHKIMETVLGLQVLLLHDIDHDLNDSDRTTADIILYGHTHHMELKFDNGHLYLNPGHLKSDKDKNHPPSFAVLDIQDRTVTAVIYNLQFTPVLRMELMRSETGLHKMS